MFKHFVNILNLKISAIWILYNILCLSTSYWILQLTKRLVEYTSKMQLSNEAEYYMNTSSTVDSGV